MGGSPHVCWGKALQVWPVAGEEHPHSHNYPTRALEGSPINSFVPWCVAGTLGEAVDTVYFSLQEGI